MRRILVLQYIVHSRVQRFVFKKFTVKKELLHFIMHRKRQKAKVKKMKTSEEAKKSPVLDFTNKK